MNVFRNDTTGQKKSAILSDVLEEQSQNVSSN